LVALLRKLELYRSSRVGRGQPRIFLGRVDNPLERFPLCHCAAGEPHSQTVSQDTLYGATIEGPQQFLIEEVIPEYSL